MSRNRHHRLPKSRGGGLGKNCRLVDSKRHELWHALFGAMTGDEIREDVNQNWLDPRFKLIVIPRNQYERTYPSS